MLPAYATLVFAGETPKWLCLGFQATPMPTSGTMLICMYTNNSFLKACHHIWIPLSYEGFWEVLGRGPYKTSYWQANTVCRHMGIMHGHMKDQKVFTLSIWRIQLTHTYEHTLDPWGRGGGRRCKEFQIEVLVCASAFFIIISPFTTPTAD